MISFVFMVSFGWSLHLLNVRQWPASIEIRLRGRIETEVRKPELVRRCLYPVALLTAGTLRPQIQIHRSIDILLEFLGVRGNFRLLCLVAEERARIDVVDRHGPELLHRWIARDAQAIRFAAVEPVAILVAISFEIHRAN